MGWNEDYYIGSEGQKRLNLWLLHIVGEFENFTFSCVLIPSLSGSEVMPEVSVNNLT